MDNVLVAVRARPLSLSESSAGCKNIVTKPNNSPQIIVNSSKQEVFTFNYAFSQDDSQEMVYANAVKPIVKRIFEGTVQPTILFLCRYLLNKNKKYINLRL